MGSVRTAAVATLIAVATVATGLVVSRLLHSDSRLEQALATLPATTQIANYTDWAAARAQLDPAITSDASVARKRAFLDRAYDRDFSVNSLLVPFEAPMQASYGWTVLDAEWEMYGQGREGAVEVLRMPPGFDAAAADRQLTKLGYDPANDDGVRSASDVVLSRVLPGLTPQLANIAVLDAEQTIVTSDSPEYAAGAARTIAGERESVLAADGVPDMAAPLGEDVVTAVVNVGRRGCTATSFEQAAPADQQLARQRIREAGGVTATQGLTLALDGQRRLLVVMTFESAEQAERDRGPRTELAAGPAPGQGGSFDERFTLDSAEGVAVVGKNLVLRLVPRSDESQLMRDLGRGGLLFASC